MPRLPGALPRARRVRRVAAHVVLVLAWPLAWPLAWLPAGADAQPATAAATARVVVDAARAEAAISPLLYGQFLEFMFEGIKGGLHAELLRDRGFEEPPNAIGLPRNWERYPDDRNDDYGLAFRWDDSVAYPAATEHFDRPPAGAREAGGREAGGPEAGGGGGGPPPPRRISSWCGSHPKRRFSARSIWRAPGRRRVNRTTTRRWTLRCSPA